MMAQRWWFASDDGLMLMYSSCRCTVSFLLIVLGIIFSLLLVLPSPAYERHLYKRKHLGILFSLLTGHLRRKLVVQYCSKQLKKNTNNSLTDLKLTINVLLMEVDWCLLYWKYMRSIKRNEVLCVEDFTSDGLFCRNKASDLAAAKRYIRWGNASRRKYCKPRTAVKMPQKVARQK